MKKFLLLAMLVVMVVSALALPALARGHFNGNNPLWGNNNDPRDSNDRKDNSNDWRGSNNNWGDDNNDWQDNNDDEDNVSSEISQDNEQDVQSGASSQAILVEGGGDNSNQCVAIQPISNTGNAVDNTDVSQYASPDGQVEVDDSGNLTISPSQSITCNQKVDQAASASDISSGSYWERDSTGAWWYWDGAAWWYLDSSGWWYYNSSDGSWTFYGW